MRWVSLFTLYFKLFGVDQRGIDSTAPRLTNSKKLTVNLTARINGLYERLTGWRN